MKEIKFKKITWLTLILVYLVILAGGIVRMTGSGMGCPDWPQCFGRWVPPTEVSQLPADYRASFSAKRSKKIDKMSDLLDKIGMHTTADKIRHNTSLREHEEPFNATKTWIEYMNRLFGFLAGNSLLLQTILAFWWFWKKRRSVVWWSVVNLVLIGFQAWFGSIVVATNLLPWVITIHMFIALIIVAIQLIIIYKMSEKLISFKGIIWARPALFIAFALTLFQVYAGTQLRQEVDYLLESGITRDNLIDTFSSKFYLHRSFAWVVLISNGLFIWLMRKQQAYKRLLILTGGLLISEILLGIILSYMSMPVFAQPMHLLIGTLLFAVQFILLFKLTTSSKQVLGS